MENKFLIYHDIDLHDICIHIGLEWSYYPGCMATYHDPEESENVEFIQAFVPDELEYRREEVSWQIEDTIGELEQEALEYIHGLFERQEVIGNEYA